MSHKIQVFIIFLEIDYAFHENNHWFTIISCFNRTMSIVDFFYFDTKLFKKLRYNHCTVDLGPYRMDAKLSNFFRQINTK